MSAQQQSLATRRLLLLLDAAGDHRHVNTFSIEFLDQLGDVVLDVDHHQIGAAPCGDFGSFHAQPVDPPGISGTPNLLGHTGLYR